MSLSDSATAPDAAAFLTTRGFGAAMVIDEAGHPVGEVMTPAVFSARADTPARSVVERMLALNVNHLFVTDDGVVVGVVTPADASKKLA